MGSPVIDTPNQTARTDSDKSQDTRSWFSYSPGMDTLPLEPVELAAIDPARNIRRHWSVVASIDLFGHVLVERRWGRIGTRGRRIVHSFTDTDRALGSGLIDHSQKIIVAARAMAERKTLGHRS